MKKKGFTLIELIVVIAIIGVLAAILVPAMLGYVKKSKITSANSSAKSIYTAAQSALTDMDTEDVFSISTLFADKTVSTAPTSWNTTKVTATTVDDATATKVFEYKVYTYFTDITKLTAVSIHIVTGSCESVAVTNGNYPGTTPKQFSVDDYDTKTNYASNLSYLISYAETGSTTASTTT